MLVGIRARWSSFPFQLDKPLALELNSTPFDDDQNWRGPLFICLMHLLTRRVVTSFAIVRRLAKVSVNVVNTNPLGVFHFRRSLHRNGFWTMVFKKFVLKRQCYDYWVKFQLLLAGWHCGCSPDHSPVSIHVRTCPVSPWKLADDLHSTVTFSPGR